MSFLIVGFFKKRNVPFSIKAEEQNGLLNQNRENEVKLKRMYIFNQ